MIETGNHTAIGRRVRIAREQANMSQGRLGALLSPPKSNVTISDIESGKVHVTWEVIEQISELTEKPLGFFSMKACPECLRPYDKNKDGSRTEAE